MKKVVRRSVSVLLSVLMVVSMFAVGITSTGAASTNGHKLVMPVVGIHPPQIDCFHRLTS